MVSIFLFILLKLNIEAGKGVFLKLEDKEDVIVKGTLLGFVPGVIHSSFEPVENETQQPEKTERRYITRYDGTSINYGEKLPYPFKLAYSLEDYNEMMADSSKVQCHYYILFILPINNFRDKTRKRDRNYMCQENL